jgi:hypothetical protein
MSVLAQKLEITKAANKYTPNILHPTKAIKATEFIIDGVIASGISFLAASAGAGKSTALVALAMRIAGLIEDECFVVSIKRKIIIFTEHSTQIEEIIIAMLADGACSKSYEEVRQDIILAHAVRMDIGDILSCAEFVDKGSYTKENWRSSKVYLAKPFVIFDTSNANFNLDNENDSQVIGKTIAAVKTEFFIKRGIPTLTATHTAKTLKHGEGDSLSARGSGAIEADAHQVIYLTTGRNNASRFLEIGAGKHRFHAKTDAIKLISAVCEIVALDHFDELIHYPVTYIAKLEATTKEQRDAERVKAAEIAKDAKARESENAIRSILLDVMERWPGLSMSLTDVVIPTKEQVISRVQKARQLVGEIFDLLVSEGHIVGHEIDNTKKNRFIKITGKSMHNRIETYYWLKSKDGDFFD